MQNSNKYIFSLVLSLFFVIFILSGCSGESVRTKQMLMSPKRDLINCALASKGATAESPDNDPEHPPSEVIDGDTSSLDWDDGGGWEGNLSHLRLDDLLSRTYIQVNLPGKRQIRELVVYTIDSPKYPAEEYGLKTYRLEYWHGTGWEGIEVTNGTLDRQYTIKDNKKGKIVHKIKGNLVTNRIRLVPISSNDIERTYSLTAFGGKTVYDVTGSARVIEIEAWCDPDHIAEVSMEESPNLLPVGKRQPSPEEQAVMKVLDSYEQGYDNENLEQVVSNFSDEFTTLDGKSKADIEAKAAKFFEEYTKINITFRDLKIYVDPEGNKATAEVNYTLDCVAVADGNPLRRSGILTFNLRKEQDGNWRITSAE
ncbi:hypothetical protein GF312_01470 [Candidatus Poribacteria bacterium]|nr:hypothetical protein [Candidatus Poribacteria bacterium]